MIRTIEALNYRCLRHVHPALDDFHVLVGPNASGKTTFLDVVAFLADLVSDGLDRAIEERTQNFADLVWRREGGQLELALEADIPEQRRKLLERPADPFVTEFIHPESVFMVHGFGRKVPWQTRGYNKGLGDYRFETGLLPVYDPAGGANSLMECFVKLEKA